MAALAAIATAGWVTWQRYAETRLETLPEDARSPVTQIVTARLSGTGTLKVVVLTGTVQATASETCHSSTLTTCNGMPRPAR